MQSSSGLYALSVRLVLGYVLLAFCRRVYRRWKYPRPLPPGPLPLPIVGNAHQLPLEYPYRKLSEWAQSYGESSNFCSQCELTDGNDHMPQVLSYTQNSFERLPL